MNRREIIAGLGGAVALPVVARPQKSDRVRRIGVLMPWDENDPVLRTWVSAFTQGAVCRSASTPTAREKADK